LTQVEEAGTCLAQDEELKVTEKGEGKKLKQIEKISTFTLTLILMLSMLANVPMASATQGPRTDDLIMTFYARVEHAYGALLAGDIDMLAYTGWSAGLPLHDGQQFTADLYAHAITDPNIVLAPLAGNDIAGFDFNNNYTIPTYPGIRSPMSYLSFRQALAFLVNKTTIKNVFKGGFADRIDVPIPYSQSGWWNPMVTGMGYPYPYAPIMAEASLDADGFIQGSTPNPYYDPSFPSSAPNMRIYPDNWWMDLDPIIFCIRTDDQAMLQAGRLLADNMRKHGIPVDQIEASKDVLNHFVMGMRDYHIYTGGWTVKKWPIYLYKLYHSDFWGQNCGNHVTGFNSTGGSNYPGLDDELRQLWLSPAFAGSVLPCNNAQQIMIDECLSVWLYSSQSFVAYSNLLGIVNMDGYGPINPYTFLNAYKQDGSPIRVGLVSSPNSLNALYSSWICDWLGLDRIYSHLMNEAPYDLSVDQPWVAQDWYVDTWLDPQDGKNKTRVTYWLRDNVYWVEPVTGNMLSQLTAHDVEFSIWYNYAYNDSWHWNDVMDVHHTRIIDNSCIEVYFDVLSYWAVYWIGEQLPLIPKHLWLDNFCEERDATVILDKDYNPCEKLMFTEDAVVQTVNVWLDGAPLTEGVDYDIVAKNSSHNWIHWLTPAYTGQNLTVSYWTPQIDPHGYTPGSLPWQTILVGSGMYYMTDFSPGVGGYLALRRNPLYWLETPVLGDIDFLWFWYGYDESRRIDVDRAPRHGCYEVNIVDFTLVGQAFGSQGTAVPSSNWFPGADVALSCGVIDNFDVATVVGSIGQRWGCTDPNMISDVAVINVNTSKTGCLPMETVGQGTNMSIYTMVENQGSASETFDVTAYHNSTLIGIQQVTLNPDENVTLTFLWNTMGVPYGNYTISATADTVSGETDTADNTMIDGKVLVTITGDVDGDRDVDIFDIVRICNAYKMTYPNPSWDPNADIIENGKIDIFDVVAAAGNYKASW